MSEVSKKFPFGSKAIDRNYRRKVTVVGFVDRSFLDRKNPTWIQVTSTSGVTYNVPPSDLMSVESTDYDAISEKIDDEWRSMSPLQKQEWYMMYDYDYSYENSHD